MLPKTKRQKRNLDPKESLVINPSLSRAAGQVAVGHLAELSAMGEDAVTPLYKVPLLTEEQIQNLLTRPDHGVQPARGIWRFPTFSDWMKKGGVRSRNNFHARFDDSRLGQMHRESQHFQRFAILYPKQLDELKANSARLFRTEEARQRTRELGIDESTERQYWEAYEKLADLVDINDDTRILRNGKSDIPQGEAYPTILSA